MRKILISILLAAFTISMAACGGGNEKTGSDTKEEVLLTKENIGDYISFSGEFVDSDYHKSLLYYISTSTLDFQAYSTVSGTCENVEITVRANIDDTGALGESWHLVDTDDSAVEFTFTMPSNGNYTHSYSLECNRSTAKLKGSCDFTVVSVSGTYIPN